MKYVRVATAALMTAAMAVLMLGSLAQAAVPETLTLNMNSPKVTFTGKLAHGHWYVVTATGTGSFVKPSMWTNPTIRHGHKPVICGTPEASPMFPTPGVTGRVGFDPETQFARPTSKKKCHRDPLPRTTRRFQLNNGNGFRHPTTLTGRYTFPRADHSYSYPILGQHHRLVARVRDRPSGDNYGALQLTLRAADDTDCVARQWHNFVNSAGNQVFADQAACEAAL